MTQASGRSALRSGSTVLAALDVLVYAPLGLGVSVVTDAPAAAKRVRQELDNARFIGRLTISQGASQLRQRLDTGRDSRAPAEPNVALDGPPAVDDEPVVAQAPVEAPEVDDLALPDYDQLPAIDIVAKLAQLSADERAVITAYETANRQRRTVLGKLAQLGDAG
jgi:hypothetical protein